MSAMENRDEVLQMLERFTRLKQKEIPRELDDYLTFVARTGDTVYPWPAVKYFFRTKLSIVITDFHDNTPSITDLPQCPNVDPFYYDRMRRTLLGRMDSFNSAPFTIQRICELLHEPRKHYTRIDKFMRAVEKNILVVSTQEPGRRRSDSENNDSLDSIVNGDLEVNVDIEMDNEAFGMDSNELATNTAAAPAAAVTEAAITTPANAEEVPPMESSEEQQPETDNHEPETVLEVPRTDNGVEVEEVNDARTEDALPKEVKVTDKDVPGTEEESSNQTKTLGSEAVAPASPDSKEEPAPNVVSAVGTDAIDEKEAIKAPAEESHDTSEPVVTEQPSNAPELDNDSTDDGEPKAKMVKRSQEEPESELADLKSTTVPAEKSPTDPDKDTVSSESTTDSNGSIEYVDNSSDERPEARITPQSSDEILPIVDISSTEYSGDSYLKLVSASDSSLSSASAVCTELNSTSAAEQETKQPELERPTEQPATAEPQIPEKSSEAPSEPAATEERSTVTEENGETIVKRINLESNPPSTNESEDQTRTPRLNPDEMETTIPENVMATDEEEQSQPGAVDTVVPMAADASEAAVKTDENAMDIDESSVEPMDQ